MAVVKNNYIKRDGREKAKAKATIRYIQHRPGRGSGIGRPGTVPGKENERQTRVLFGRDGAMGRQEAYRMIDEAVEGSVFFRFIVSPDSQTEDTKRDLHLRDVTAKTMLSLEERINQPVQWVAAEHDDHTPHRHVHIVAVVPGRLSRQDFQALPQALRSAATEAALEQRQELDIVWAHQARGEREEAAWVQSL